ncbi:hypothetical protein HY772_08020 [Candidatus Woesearchaeota archaeon]|nr:hypothetical protein [Candidatus Woesearchaeota archaeon]
MKKLERFCPLCGTKEILHGNTLCSACAALKAGFAFKDIVVTICACCGKFLLRHKWVESETVEGAVASIALEKIKCEIKHYEIKHEEYPRLEILPRIPDKTINPGLDSEFNIDVSVGEERYSVPATIRGTVCPYCSKQETPYFEGVLQLRNPTRELLSYVRKDIAENQSRGIFISKEIQQPDGVDFQISSNKYLRALGKRLQVRFMGEFKESPRLFTRSRQTSKDVYRLSVYFRLRPYAIGQVVKKGEREIKITSIGKRVHGSDRKTGKKVFLE